MEPTRRHPQEPQDRSQREVLTGPIDGAQDLYLGASVRETLFCEAKPGGSYQGQHEPEQRRELLDASAQLQDLRRSSGSVRSATSRQTTTVGAAPSQPRAVERGTPRFVATGTSPVRWTRCRRRWSER